MTAVDLVRYASDALFLVVFLAALASAIRERRRAAIDAALFFGALALVVVQGEAARLLGLTLPPVASEVFTAAVIALPYLLLRVADDLAGVRREVLVAALVLLAAAIAGLLAVGRPLPAWFTVAVVAYFVALQLYASALLFGATRRASGVPRERSRAAVAGSVLLGLAVLVAGLQVFLGPLESLTRVLALASAVAYYAAFAPPGLLKRAWREPALRSFLAHAAAISPNTQPTAIAARLEEGVAAAAGGAGARIGVWDEERALLFRPGGTEPVDGILARAYLEGAPFFLTGGPAHAAAQDPLTRTVIVTPISARGRRLGALALELRHEPLFVADDVAFAVVLAEQAGLVLDSARIYQELARVNRGLAEATRAKTEFLASMSHELRTPLNAILGFSDLLVEQLGATLTDPQQRYFRNIREAGQHLLELINEVLDLSKVEAGRIDLRPDTIALASLVEPVVTSTRADAERRGVAFQAEISDVAVRVDAGRMRQVLYNLLSNAVKFTDSGGHVRFGATTAGRDLIFEVADTGIGIPADRQGRVFGTFERLHEGRSEATGTGLGLALTKHLVELHGGTIAFESKAGLGTTFRVRIPGVTTVPMTGSRLLVVEDVERDAELIAALAAEAGLRSEIVGSALGAREAIRRDPPSAVVLDLRLPDERGERVLEALKGDPITRDIPVIVVTIEDDDGRSRPLGADDHITKPIDRERLGAWLRGVATSG